MAPNIATQSTIASADAIVARRMPDLQPQDATTRWVAWTEFLNPTLVANSRPVRNTASVFDK
jgi:hypothetical protein